MSKLEFTSDFTDNEVEVAVAFAKFVSPWLWSRLKDVLDWQVHRHRSYQ